MSAYRVCVLGNSHSAALHMAWTNRLAGTMPGVALSFFAAKSQLLRNLSLEDGKLLPRDADLADALVLSSGGLSHVEIGRYDAFLLAGLGVRITLTALCQEHGTVAHRKWGEVETLVSEACFAAMLEAGLADNPAFWLLDRIRETGSTAPVLICPTPFYSDVELDRRFMRRHARLGDPAFRAMVIEQGRALATALAARRGGEMLWQDESTIASPGYTKREFARAALRLGKEASEDGKHMNEDFGAIVLANALTRLGGLGGSQAAGADRIVPFPGPRRSA